MASVCGDFSNKEEYFSFINENSFSISSSSKSNSLNFFASLLIFSARCFSMASIFDCIFLICSRRTCFLSLITGGCIIHLTYLLIIYIEFISGTRTSQYQNHERSEPFNHEYAHLYIAMQCWRVMVS